MGSIALFSQLFFEGCLGAFFGDLGAIFGGFGRPKWRPKSMFGTFFAMFFSSAFWNRFFGDFSFFFTVRTLNLVRMASVFYRFHKIDVFKKDTKKRQIWVHFWRSKRQTIEKKRCRKTCFFLTSIFTCFFADFCNFGTILGGPGPSKKWQKIKKIEKQSHLERIWSALGVPWSLWNGFGSDLGGFGEGFGSVLGGIWKDFGPFGLDFALIFWSFQRAVGNRCIHD